MTPFDSNDFTQRYANASETSESPIEHLLQMMLEKYLHPDAQLTPQAPMKTRRANFRADFLLITATGERLVLECDGKDFHDPVRDSLRDAFMLADDLADYIYRFPGHTLHRYRIWDALFTLYYQQPGVFSQGGREDILSRFEHLVDPALLDEGRFAHPPESLNTFGLKDSSGGLFEVPPEITVRAGRNRRGAPLFGVELIQFARENPGKPLDELVNQLYDLIKAA